ncbi:Crp/Fnr family transcriptional regulator [Rubrobacter tropicus]|nr:Crp/Fnr family transcriptional regulator [Rubrobacter tropicus]
MMRLSGAAVALGEYAAPEGRGCRRLLAALRETGTPLVRRSYDGGEEIYRGDDAGRTLYVLTGGVAKLFVGYAGYVGSKDATFLLLGPWECFGFSAFADGRKSRFSAGAVTDCEAIKVPGALVERAIRRRPEVALEMATLLETRLVEYEELLGCLLPRRTEVRLAKLLPILGRKFGETTDVGVAIGLRLTRGDLATMVASTRESVTAAVIGLRKKGILEMEGGRIVLLDPERLAEIGRQ